MSNRVKDSQDNLISDIRFIPMADENTSLRGWAHFTYHGNIAIKDVAVHIRADRKGYRLVYPKNKDIDRSIVYPRNKETQQAIELAINAYIEKQGVTHDESTSARKHHKS